MASYNNSSTWNCKMKRIIMGLGQYAQQLPSVLLSPSSSSIVSPPLPPNEAPAEAQAQGGLRRRLLTRASTGTKALSLRISLEAESLNHFYVFYSKSPRIYIISSYHHIMTYNMPQSSRPGRGGASASTDTRVARASTRSHARWAHDRMI